MSLESRRGSLHGCFGVSDHSPNSSDPAGQPHAGQSESPPRAAGPFGPALEERVTEAAFFVLWTLNNTGTGKPSTPAHLGAGLGDAEETEEPWPVPGPGLWLHACTPCLRLCPPTSPGPKRTVHGTLIVHPSPPPLPPPHPRAGLAGCILHIWERPGTAQNKAAGLGLCSQAATARPGAPGAPRPRGRCPWERLASTLALLPPSGSCSAVPRLGDGPFFWWPVDTPSPLPPPSTLDRETEQTPSCPTATWQCRRKSTPNLKRHDPVCKRDRMAATWQGGLLTVMAGVQDNHVGRGGAVHGTSLYLPLESWLNLQLLQKT